MVLDQQEDKYQKALDEIVATSCPARVPCRECSLEKSCNSINRQNVITLMELIYKQKKIFPCTESTGYQDGHPANDIGECPICGHEFDRENNEEPEYCPNCGQHLNWNFEEIMEEQQ